MGLLIVWLALFLAGCTLPGTPAPTPTAGPPLPTLEPTRAALATSTAAVVAATLAPSATPDPTIVPEQFVSPEGVLAFRYPTGWTVENNSGDGELLVTAESPLVGETSGVFVANLINVEGELATADLQPLADGYLRNLFAEEYDALAISFRQAGDEWIATTTKPQGGETVQFEVRFAPRPPFYQVLVLIAAQAEWDRVAPTLDAMARSVQVNAAGAAVVPTPTAAVTRQSDGLALQNASLYQAATGSLYLVGEVANGSAQGYEDVQVTLTLVDAAGAELAREQWATQRPILPPSERSPLLVIFNQTPSGWADFRATVDALPAGELAPRVSTAFEAVDVTASQPTFGAYALAGQVRNVGAAARDVEVVGALYDAAGRVLAVETTTLGSLTLAGGESAPFTLTFFSKAEGEVARHELWLQGRLPSAEETLP